MDCDPTSISCWLGEIATRMAEPNWAGFLLTLSATLVGALVAAFIGLLPWRSDRNARYARALDEASVDVMRAIPAYINEIERWTTDLANRWDDPSKMTFQQPKKVQPPQRDGLDTAIEVLTIRAIGKDRDLAMAIREVAYDLTSTPAAPDVLRAELAALRRVIWRWRSGQVGWEATLTDLLALNKRLSARLAGRPDDAPRLPAPFERRHTPNPQASTS